MLSPRSGEGIGEGIGAGFCHHCHIGAEEFQLGSFEFCLLNEFFSCLADFRASDVRGRDLTFGGCIRVVPAVVSAGSDPSSEEDEGNGSLTRFPRLNAMLDTLAT